MTTITTDEIIKLIKDGERDLYVRWSAGPEVDRNGCSKDYQTGQNHGEYGLSANSILLQDRVTEFDAAGYPIGVAWESDFEYCEYYGLERWIRMQCTEYSFLPGKPWIMRAKRIGTDSDGAALIDSRSFEFLGYWEE